MNGQTPSKLKSLLQSVPPGFLVDSAWLTHHGISRQSASAYVKEGWLERVAQGVYRRPFTTGENAEAVNGWKIPLLSAQWIMERQFHVGGMSALTLHGHAHYLALGGRSVMYLYGDDVPEWLMKLPVDATFKRRGLSLFSDRMLGVEQADFSLSDADGELALSPWRWPLRVASPERAILEALEELPANETFHNLDMVFEGLANLRPKRLGELLVHCKSVKAKRLFFAYADRHAHAWRKHLKAEDFDLGRGDRSLIPGGRLHPTYRITLPAELIGRTEGSGDGA